MSDVKTELSHLHRFVAGDAEHPLLLLHGTGGDESDLLSLGAHVAPGAALLSPRGRVSEGGANRFFRRFAEGVFDAPDLKARTDDLADFIATARREYGLGQPVALGFSNGANIAASLLLRRPETLAGAVLLRAMTPYVPETLPVLGGKPVLILSGAMDPIIPAEDAAGLAEMLRRGGAAVTHKVLTAGHGLTQTDLAATTAWLAAQR